MKIQITQARLENAAALSALSAELGYPSNPINTREWLSYLLSSANHHVLVALGDAETVCGWLVVEKRISLETGFKAEITGLIVGENFRRFGIGQKLVAAAEQWAKTLDLTKIVVRSNVQREVSHVFYKNLGFVFKKSAHNYEMPL